MNSSGITNRIMEIFKEINSIPRCSKHEEKIADFLLDWAKKRNFDAKKDKANNVVINVPATRGCEKKESIALQGHMDMVCEKTTDSQHDFSKDPIKVIRQGDWVRADSTTLGADDGVALAIGLAIASTDDLEHPKLELLFTADEETGMNGAKNLQTGFFKSKKLINIDSEREGVFTIGCAGGEDTDIEMPVRNEIQEGYFYEITIDGLLGGHSGVEIDKLRANALKLIVEFLKSLDEDSEARLSSINGGSARNAIPKHASAVIYMKKAIKAENIALFYKEILEQYPEEKNIKIDFKQLKNIGKVFVNSKEIIELLDELPHGIYEKTELGITKTSNNLAKVITKKDKLIISTNQRSLTEEGLNTITAKIENIANKYKAKYVSYNRYPSWQPNYNSTLVTKSSKIYEKLFSKKPKIEVIHAGLECGIIGSLNKDMDMISIGPDMKNIHTPQESLYIPSLEKVWRLIVAILKEI